MTDEHLMQRYQAGDDAAFSELESRYNSRLLAFFLKWLSLPNLADAQDLAADTWIGVICSKSSFNSDIGRFFTWLFGIARNIGKDALAKRYRGELPWSTAESENEPSADEDGPVCGDELADVEAAMISRITVAEALEKLSPSDREVLLLYYVYDCTGPEIAQILSCSTAAAKSRLRRALQKILEHVLPEVQTVPKRRAI